MEQAQTFLEYISAAREQFVTAINNQEWNTQMRVEAENLLIAYDQMREKLSSQGIQVVESKTYEQVVLSHGYIQEGHGFKLKTEVNTHWVTLFEGSKVQLYAYCSEDIYMDSVYSTNIINVTPEQLGMLIQVFVESNP